MPKKFHNQEYNEKFQDTQSLCGTQETSIMSILPLLYKILKIINWFSSTKQTPKFVDFPLVNKYPNLWEIIERRKLTLVTNGESKQIPEKHLLLLNPLHQSL